jgi:hypothetical protein
MKVDSNFKGDWNDVCEYCGQPQEAHKIDYGTYEGTHYIYRMPCKQEQEQITLRLRNKALTVKGLIFFGWVLIPLFIAIVGFANFWVGLLLFVISLVKIAIEYVKLFGNADEWIPGHKEKMEKERKMRHYYYHCEKNPNGFRKIFIENLADEE